MGAPVPTTVDSQPGHAHRLPGRVYIDFTVSCPKTQLFLPPSQIFRYFHKFSPLQYAVYAEFHRVMVALMYASILSFTP